MGKRLIRLLAKELLQQLPNHIGQELNIVLRDKTTMHGVLKKVNENLLELQDLLQRKHLVKVEEVEEVILDKEASF